MDAARERLLSHGDAANPPEATGKEETAETPAEGGLTVDPAFTDGPFGDAPVAPPETPKPATRPGRRRTGSAT